jgi:DNA-binding Lrp family transcriptional regulator
MSEMKPVDRKALFELMKNSRRSDRELAKILDVSQPTVTRKRASFEKELIESYTVIPRWTKLGYNLFAITLVKIKTIDASKGKYDTVRKRGTEWLMNQPNILMGGGCRGMGVDSFMISIHKTYSDFDEFMHNYRLELGDLAEDVQSVIVNLAGRELIKPLNFRYLAEAETKKIQTI